MEQLEKFLDKSYTQYQCADLIEDFLGQHGFARLSEKEDWKLEKGKGYYVIRGGSSVIAFKAGEQFSFNIVSSHTDSPCFKIKNNPEVKGEFFTVGNTEKYGGMIMSSFFDRPLKIAGRLLVEDGNKIIAENIVSDFYVTIPSVAIHMGTVDSDKLNPQIDTLPLCGLKNANILQSLTDKKVIDYDLYVVSAEKPFYSGINNEFLSSPRIDNKTSVYASLLSLAESNDKCINIACCFDNEEVGSSTKQGADSTFLTDVLSKIAFCYNKSEGDLKKSLCDTLFVSLDNAHSMHPNHKEKNDPTNKCVMGKGIVIKHHANQSYTTDGFSSALIKKIFSAADAEYQDYYNRSDMRGGSTLGAISATHLSVLSVDIGLAQLAMHSAVEIFCKYDFDVLVKGLKGYYNSLISINGAEAEIL